MVDTCIPTQVLTLPQYREMIAPAPPKPTQLAKALFDFTGQRDRELTFKKVQLVNSSCMYAVVAMN